VAKYRRKPTIIEATQWLRNGDHPKDESAFITPKDGRRFLSEGKIVRRFRRPDITGDKQCSICDYIYHDHGWIDTLQGDHMVCPGDWIISLDNGEHYPCKLSVFEKTYEEINPERK